MLKLIEQYSYVCVGILIALTLLLSGTLIYGYRELQNLESEFASLVVDLENTTATLAQKVTEANTLNKILDDIKQAYALSEENGSELLNQLTEEKDRNDAFEEQIEDISGTVGKLDKLSKMDPKLLQKYSKVYFLNEHFLPESTSPIDPAFVLRDEPEYIHSKVLPFLTDLLEDAKEDGVDLITSSGYRSFGEQKSIKNTYTIIYGVGANTFAADQGYSEHQLGTTVDFTTTNNAALDGFEATPAYAWLQKNAHRYGFTLSYPKDNAYYIFEPWHWRFVGEDLADDLDDAGKYFYDLDQREIDTYLISLFD